MKEKIVILGNGFDLRHFLPTSYNHLISILIEIDKFPENIDLVNFSTLFDGDFKERNDLFYKDIKEFYNTDDIIFDKSKILSINERLKENSWFKYLKSVDENKIETWIDLENEISKVLEIIVDFFVSFEQKKEILHKNQRQFSEYLLQHTNYDNFFNNNVQKNVILNFSLFETLSNLNQFIKINHKYFLIIENKIQYIREKKFLDSLYNSLEEFIGIFNDYIIYVVDKFYSNFKIEKRANFISIGNQILFDKVKNIYSFNYTHTYNKFYKSNPIEILKKTEDDNYVITRLEQIHGYAIENWGNKLDNLKMVLGVSEINITLKSHKLYQFTKYFQKLHKNTDYLFLDSIIKDLKISHKGQQDYTLYFWGHSLDSSDLEYIREVFEVVSKSDNEIKIFYHSISAKADQLKNLLNIIDKNIIENLMKHKKLQFLEATNENLFKELS